jgi:hypothetical protein
VGVTAVESTSYLAKLSGRGHSEEEQRVAEADASWIQGEVRLQSFAATLMAWWRRSLLCCDCGRVERAKRGKMASEGGSSGSAGRVKARSGLRGPPGATRTPSTASGGHAAAIPCSRLGERGRTRGRPGRLG